MIFMITTPERRAASPQELTEARATLAAERHRVRALSLFARRMSHDMSNFVTVVRTYSELLLADIPTDVAIHGDVQEIHRAADAMIDYMHRIVRFARSAAVDPGAFAFDDAIADSVRSSSFSDRVDMQLASAASVRMDAALLADSVRELIANACEASPAGSLVQVRTWTEHLPSTVIDGGMPIDAGNWTVLELADEGAGFAREILADALDPFVSSKQAVRGAGFGLSLARSAAWSGGGQLIIAAPNAEVPGARVRMWLPAAVD